MLQSWDGKMINQIYSVEKASAQKVVISIGLEVKDQFSLCVYVYSQLAHFARMYEGKIAIVEYHW